MLSKLELKKALFIIFLLLSTLILHAQSPSNEALLAKMEAVKDSCALDILFKYCRADKAVCSSLPPQAREKYLQKHYEIEKDERLLAYIYAEKAYSYYPTNRDSTLYFLKIALKAAIKTSDYHTIGNAYYDMAFFYQYSDYVNAYINFEEAFFNYKKMNPQKVLRYYIKDFEYGKFLLKIEENEQALEYFKHGLSITDTSDHKYIILHTHAIGLCYEKLNNYNKALEFYTQVYKMEKARNNIIWEGLSLGYIADVCWKLNQKEKTLIYYDKAIAIIKTTISKDLEIEFAMKYAQYLIDMGKENQAYDLVMSYGNIAETHSALETKIKFFKLYAAALEKKGNSAKALFYFKKFYEENELENKKKSGLDYIKGRVRIEANKAKKEIHYLENEKRNLINTRNLILLFMLLSFIAIWFYIISVRKTSLEKQKNLELAKQIAEKDAEIKLNELEQSKALTQKENELKQAELDHAKIQLFEFTQSIIDKNKLIEQIQIQLNDKNEPLQQINTEQAHEESLLDETSKSELAQFRLLTEDDWQKFKSKFDQAFPDFMHRLAIKYPNLTKAEIRLITLSKLQINTKDMASMLGISPESLRKTKYRLKEKIGIDTNTVIKELFQ